jgi:predicted GH43/DUF377 family glycosyl hydrolase
VIRRHFLQTTLGVPFLGALPASAAPIPDQLKTPHKLNRLVVRASEKAGAFDEKSVDCPFVCSNAGRFYMTYVGFDGTGYQTGLASSDDLVTWKPEGLILARDSKNPVTRYNVALTWILRENDVFSPGKLKKMNGRFVGTYHAYPSAGYEEGPAVIGLCWSEDLRHWQVDSPCLLPADGAAWERGGLYKACLVEEKGTYYLFYNAKTEEKQWHEQIGVATSRDLKTWTRHEGNPTIPNGGPGSVDEKFASDPCVLKFGNKWAIFYYSLDAKGKARDLLALSPDLMKAQKCEGILVDVSKNPEDVDSTYAHKPSVIAKDGVLYHYYCAVSEKHGRGIGVATSRPLAR